MKRIKYAAFLAIPLLCAAFVNAQTTSSKGTGTLKLDSTMAFILGTGTTNTGPTLDTIPVLLLISDTSYIHGRTWHEQGYQVRYKYCCVNGNTSNLAYYQPVPWYEHYLYLNDKKSKFKKSIVVWQALAHSDQSF